MRIASFVMAIIGTVFGIIFGLFAMAVGGVANAFSEGAGDGVVALGMSAIAACLFGMLCSGFHFGGKRQGWMAAGLFVAAGWHVISISWYGAPGFLFFFLAALFAVFGRSPAAPRAPARGPGSTNVHVPGVVRTTEPDMWHPPAGFRPYAPPPDELAPPTAPPSPVREPRHRARYFWLGSAAAILLAGIAVAAVLVAGNDAEPAAAGIPSSTTVRSTVPATRSATSAAPPSDAVAVSPTAVPATGASTVASTNAARPGVQAPGKSRRADPVPIGVSVRIGDWVLRVDSVVPNATQQVRATNQFNSPPAQGRQFYMVRVSTLYDGKKDRGSLLLSKTFQVVGASNVAYDSSDDCGVLPDELDTTKDVYQGGTISGNLCWSVTTGDVSSLVLRVDQAFSLEDTTEWFALR